MMKVEFKIHQKCQQGLELWLEELAGTEPGGQLLARVILDAIRVQLIHDEGYVAEAIRDEIVDPPLFWWRVHRDTWISYVVRETGFWRWRKRKITLYSVAERPPDRVVASFPRS